jgi:RluA family pseudouridine synthase
MPLQMHSDHTELSFHYTQIKGKEETLLDFLLRRFRYFDAQEWTEHINAGRLMIDGRVGRPQQKLRNSQQILYLRPDYLEPAVDDNYEVVYEDEWLIALNKSGDMPTSPSGKYFKNTLMYQVRERFGWKKLYTVHRLDRETSGIVIFAKTHAVAQQMAELFRHQRIQKEYRAIVQGALPQPSVFVSLPIGSNPASEIRIKQWAHPAGKPSQTWFFERKRLEQVSYLQIKPLTGRTHQIRVHAAVSGFPIVGDKLYSLGDAGFLEWLRDGDAFLSKHRFPSRQLLHAQQIQFQHPCTNELIEIEATDEAMLEQLPS